MKAIEFENEWDFLVVVVLSEFAPAMSNYMICLSVGAGP